MDVQIALMEEQNKYMDDSKRCFVAKKAISAVLMSI